MAHIRLSSDILSPIQSDISLNDASYSFGSAPATPDFDKGFKLSRNRHAEKDVDTGSFYNMKEKTSALEMVVDDIKKQSSINAEKEEKFKDTYEKLKHSMDELFYIQGPDPSILSPIMISENMELINLYSAEDMTCSEFRKEKRRGMKDPEANKEACISITPESKHMSKRVNKKVEKNSKTNVSNMKKESRDNRPVKNPSQQKDSTRKFVNKCGNKANLEAEAENGDVFKRNKAKKDTKTSSTQTSPGLLSESDKEEKGRTLMDKYCSQRRNPISNSLSSIEKNKGLSLEKTIGIAVSVEMDNIRSFMMDQNMSLQKEMRNLQKTQKKHSEVTEYLFSVVDQLLDSNRKLIAKHS